MTVRVSTMEVRQKLGEILNRVALRHDQYIVERNGKPLAAVVPIEQFEQMQAAARLLILGALDRAAEDISADDAETLADEAKHQSR